MTNDDAPELRLIHETPRVGPDTELDARLQAAQAWRAKTEAYAERMIQQGKTSDVFKYPIGKERQPHLLPPLPRPAHAPSVKGPAPRLRIVPISGDTQGRK